MNNSVYGRIKKYSKILKDNEVLRILSTFIPNVEIKRSYKIYDKLILEFDVSTTDYDSIELTVSDEEIRIKKSDRSTIEDTIIKTSKRVRTTLYEMHDKGYIIRKIERSYDYTRFSNKHKCLVDLIETSYLFSKNTTIVPSLKKLYSKYSSMCFDFPIDYYADEIIKFRSHMKNLIKDGNGRYITDSIYSTYTYIDDKDVSHIFDIVEGENKISRIYDLYNGIITKENEYDIRSIHLGLLCKDAYDLKGVRGIREKENEIVGERLPVDRFHYLIYVENLLKNEYDLKEKLNLDRDFIINILSYVPTGPERAKKELENIIGMPYDRFNELDIDDQDRMLLKSGKKINLDKLKKRKVKLVEKLLKDKPKILRRFFK